MYITQSSNDTYFFEDNERVFPCRCGETHRGDYAQEENVEHECFHDCGLLKVDEHFAMCNRCGAGFVLED